VARSKSNTNLNFEQARELFGDSQYLIQEGIEDTCLIRLLCKYVELELLDPKKTTMMSHSVIALQFPLDTTFSPFSPFFVRQRYHHLLRHTVRQIPDSHSISPFALMWLG